MTLGIADKLMLNKDKNHKNCFITFFVLIKWISSDQEEEKSGTELSDPIYFHLSSHMLHNNDNDIWSICNFHEMNMNKEGANITEKPKLAFRRLNMTIKTSKCPWATTEPQIAPKEQVSICECGHN